MSDLISDLHRAVRRVGAKHGYDVPEFPVFEAEGALFANLTLYRGEARESYRRWYIEHGPALGLERAWLDASFVNPKSARRLTLIGLDPDGGEWPVRVVDDEGQSYHMSPSAVRRLIAQHSDGSSVSAAST